MLMKLSSLLICVIAILTLGVATALALDAPQNLTVAVVGDDLACSWDAVDGADKYSVDVEAVVTLDLGGGVTEEVEVELSYGTSDRTDGEDMDDPNLTVPLLDGVTSQLGVLAEEVVSIDGTVRVKALNPGNGRGRQNHDFSAPVSFSWP